MHRAGLQARATVDGHVWLELSGHVRRGVLDQDAHPTTVVDRVADDLGLPGPDRPR